MTAPPPPAPAGRALEAARAASSLALASVLVALAASGLSVFLGHQAAPARRIEEIARELHRDPLLALGTYHALLPALVALALAALTLAALAPAPASALARPPWPARLRAAAWTLLPFALLPAALWYDEASGRAIIAAALVGLSAYLAATSLARPGAHPAPISPRAARLAAATLAAATGLFLFAVAYQRHRAHWSSLIDLGLFYELYDNPEGRLLYSPTLGMSFLGEHFSPILALLWPIVALARTPVALLAIQAATIAAGAYLLYELAARRTKSHALGLALLLAYALCPFVQRAAFYDFHLDMLEPPLIFGFALACISQHRRRHLWMWLCAVLLWATKEDTFIYTSVMATVFLIAEGRRREGIAIIAAGLVAGAIVLSQVLPALRAPYDPAYFSTVGVAEGYAFGGRYSNLGQTPADALRLLLLNPFGWLSDVLSGAGLSSVLALALVFGPTTLTARWRAVLIIPAFEMLLGERMRAFPFYYGAVVMPFAALTAIEGARELALRRERPPGSPEPDTFLDFIARRTTSSRLAIGLLAGSAALWSFHPASALSNHSDHGFLRTEHQVRAEALLDALPPGAPVAATGYLAVHLQSRHPTAMFPYGLDTAEHVIVDLQRPPWPITYGQLQSRLEQLVASGHFAVQTADRETGLIALARVPRVVPAAALLAARDLRLLLAAPVMEAELTEDTAFRNRRTADPDAQNGALLSIESTDPRGPAHAFFGPYLTLPPGRYRASFRLRWFNDLNIDLRADRPLVDLDIHSRGSPDLAARRLTAADLAPIAGHFAEPSLEFELPDLRRDIELRVYFHAIGRLDLDVVRLDRLGDLERPSPRPPR